MNNYKKQQKKNKKKKQKGLFFKKTKKKKQKGEYFLLGRNQKLWKTTKDFLFGRNQKLWKTSIFLFGGKHKKPLFFCSEENTKTPKSFYSEEPVGPTENFKKNFLFMKKPTTMENSKEFFIRKKP